MSGALLCDRRPCASIVLYLAHTYIYKSRQQCRRSFVATERLYLVCIYMLNVSRMEEAARTLLLLLLWVCGCAGCRRVVMEITV